MSLTPVKYSDNAKILEIDSLSERSGFFIASEYKDFKKYLLHTDKNISEEKEWSFFRISENGEGILLSSKINYFYDDYKKCHDCGYEYFDFDDVEGNVICQKCGLILGEYIF